MGHLLVFAQRALLRTETLIRRMRLHFAAIEASRDPDLWRWAAEARAREPRGQNAEQIWRRMAEEYNRMRDG